MYSEKFADAGIVLAVVTFVLLRASMNAWDASVLSRSCTYRGTGDEPDEPKIAPNRRMRRIGKTRAKNVPTRERRYWVPKAFMSARIRFMPRAPPPAFERRPDSGRRPRGSSASCKSRSEAYQSRRVFPACAACRPLRG